jgi:hypothetical protein
MLVTAHRVDISGKVSLFLLDVVAEVSVLNIGFEKRLSDLQYSLRENVGLPMGRQRRVSKDL